MGGMCVEPDLWEAEPIPASSLKSLPNGPIQYVTGSNA